MYETEQESFWAEAFGDEYIDRNKSEDYLASNIHFFSKILSRSNGIESVMEIGPNIGMNLLAIKKILPKSKLAGVEINKKAFEILCKNLPQGVFYNESVLEHKVAAGHDLVFSKGVMIHLNPEKLEIIYKKMYEMSRKYLLVAEYYNPTPVEILYRGHREKLFKRDFCSEIMSMYPDLELVDYGFAYHGDKSFPQDDLTWFLLKK